MERYARNMHTLSPEENEALRKRGVVVVGCGGLGGYVIEMLGRLGVGCLSVIDGDCFDESNLNRQILADTGNLGNPKAMAAKKRMNLVNPEIKVNAVIRQLSKDNALSLVKGHDVAVDALDNVGSRLILAEACRELKIPLVHGAIAGWYGQAATILPGENTMERLCRQGQERGIEARLGNPSFTPALIAAIQVSEVVKLLIGRGDLLSGGKILFVDTLHQEYQII